MPSSGFELPSALATVLLFPACWFQHIREPADCDFKAVFIIWGLNYIFSPQAHIYCLSSGTRMPNYGICRFKSKPVFERALLISAEFLWCLLSVSNVSWIKLIWTDVLAFAGPSFSIAIKSDDSSVYPWETAKMECSLSVSGSSPKTGTAHTHTQHIWRYCMWGFLTCTHKSRSATVASSFHLFPRMHPDTAAAPTCANSYKRFLCLLHLSAAALIRMMWWLRVLHSFSFLCGFFYSGLGYLVHCTNISIQAAFTHIDFEVCTVRFQFLLIWETTG